MLLRWDGMRWEPRRAVNTRLMRTLEASRKPDNLAEHIL